MQRQTDEITYCHSAQSKNIIVARKGSVITVATPKNLDRKAHTIVQVKVVSNEKAQDDLNLWTNVIPVSMIRFRQFLSTQWTLW
jgi:hypothetical protein